MIPIGRPQFVVVSILVLILAAVLYRLLYSEDTPYIIDGTLHKLEEHLTPQDSFDNGVSTTMDTSSEPEVEKRTTCSLQKVNEPPNMLLFMAFPVIRVCKKVNILERIGSISACKSLGMLLLEDDSGQKVKAILYKEKDDIVEANREILYQWLKGNWEKPVTWRTLIDVLKLDSVGLKNLATDVQTSCDPSILDTPPQWYPFVHVKQLADDLREVYSGMKPVDPSQNLLSNLGNVSFKLPFVMPQLSDGKQFDDVLNELEVGSRLLITGRPGVGKSTLTRYTAQMWANNSLLHHCQLLIRVPLYDSIDSLETLLVKYCHKTKGSDSLKLVTEEIKENKGKGVCFLLDSFDEYRRHHGNHGEDFILSLLMIGSDYHVLPKATVIMTSRPEAVTDIHKYFNKKLTIDGFEKENITTYVENLPPPYNETIAVTLDNYPHVKLMCSTPLHLTMLVCLASVDVKNLSTLTRETSLYAEFLFMTVNQFKPAKLPWNKDYLEECFEMKLSQSELCLLFRNICRLAYDVMKDKEQSFNSTLLPKEYRDKAETLSLFTIETKTAPVNNVFVYYFSHRTFLEFITACHLFMLPEENQTNEIYWFKNRYNDPISELVWKFFFGLLGKYDVNSLKTSFEYLTYRNSACCNISRSPIASTYGHNIDNKFSNIELLEFAYEAEMDDDDISQVVRERKVLVGPTFTDEVHLSLYNQKEYLFLGYALQISAFQRVVLDLSVPPDCSVSFIGFLDDSHHHVEEIDLKYKTYGPSLSEEAIECLFTVLQASRLKRVTLNFGFDQKLNYLSLNLLENLNPEEVERLKITGSMSRVTHVHMNTILYYLKRFPNLINLEFRIGLNSSGIIVLCNALVEMPQLQLLDLSIRDINSTAANVLAGAIRRLNKLRSLTLDLHIDYFTLGDEQPRVITNNFSSDVFQQTVVNHTMLESLRLHLKDDKASCNCTDLIIGVFGLENLKWVDIDIRNCIRIEHTNDSEVVYNWHQPSKLEYLSIVLISDAQAATVIMQRIRSSPKLRTLKIHCSQYIESHLFQLLRDEFRNLSELEEFWLTSCGFYDSEHLADGLTKLKSLRSLHLQIWSEPTSKKHLKSATVEQLVKCLPSLSQLTELSVSWSKLNDDELKELAGAIKHLTQLTVLDLAFNDFGDDAAMAVSKSLPYLTKLEYLDLSKNKIGTEAALAVVNSLQNATSLVFLDVEHNHITSRGAWDMIKKAVQHLPNLKPDRVRSQRNSGLRHSEY